MLILRLFAVCLLLFVNADQVAPQLPETNVNVTNANSIITGTEISDIPGLQNNVNLMKGTDVSGTPGLVNIANPKDREPDRRATDINTKKGISSEVDDVNPIIKLYISIENAIKTFFTSQKVMMVIQNVGACVVNGIMEIVTFYLPAPMIPLIASAAGMVIPFEPVVTLRNKMPVTSYRRALNRAVNSFMGTFDKYKIGDNDDPYMTRRFNRRFMDDNSDEKKEDKSKN